MRDTYDTSDGETHRIHMTATTQPEVLRAAPPRYLQFCLIHAMLGALNFLDRSEAQAMPDGFVGHGLSPI